MSLEPIGIATILIGLFCLFVGNSAILVVLCIAPVFGAAAALIAGPANIQPGHVLLGFLAIGIFTRKQETRNFLAALRLGQPGSWFLLLVAYGVMGAYFFPVLLSGETQIMPLGNTVFGETTSAVPLVRVSTNLTQSVYMISGLLCFAMTVSAASTDRGFNAAFIGLMGYCVANTLFAFVDVFTYSTNTQSLMEFMRNAQYVLHTEEQVNGLKRIVGSFTEASAFSRSTLGVMTFCGTLWLCGRQPLLNGLIAVTSLVLLVLSTSSSGLAGAPLALMIIYFTALTLSGRSDLRKMTTTVLFIAPLVVLAVAIWVGLTPTLAKIVYNYADIVVLGKADTSSGIERSSWNQAALQNAYDTFGLGVGLGSARTSSFAVALIANVGIVGTIFYAMFFCSALMAKRVRGTFAADVQLAARNGCFGLIIGDVLIASTTDQGLFFYMLAGIAAARPVLESRPQPTVAMKGAFA